MEKLLAEMPLSMPAQKLFGAALAATRAALLVDPNIKRGPLQARILSGLQVFIKTEKVDVSLPTLTSVAALLARTNGNRTYFWPASFS